MLIKDQQQDTILSARKLTANISSFKRKKREVVLGNVRLDHSQIRFRTDSSNRINIIFIINEIRSKKDTTKDKLDLKIKRIEVRESVFTLKLNKFKPRENGINFTDLYLNNLNFNLSEMTVFNDTMQFQINDLTFTDRSGFHVDRLTTNFRICRTSLLFDDISLVTPLSQINADHIEFAYSDYPDLKNFKTRVGLNLRIRSTDLNFDDLGYFVAGLSWVNQNINLSGNFTGKISDLKGKNVFMQFSDQTSLSGSFEIEGLPDINEAFLFIDVNNLTTSIENLEQFEKPATGEKLLLPESFKRLGIINFKGNFTGFIDDFVTYGKFTSDLGMVSTDLSIRPDTSGYLNFKGRLKTFEFEIGELTHSEKYVGKMTMNTILNGKAITAEQFEASLEGFINSIEFNEYNYTNVELTGDFTHNAYDGSIYIEDPNVKLNFLGRLDFSQEIPEFDFTANVPRANLYELNIDRTDTNSFLSFLLTANFTGSNMDNINGNIKLLNLDANRLGKELQVYDFTLSADNQIDTSTIMLRTDFLDGELTGKYEFAYLKNSVKSIVSNFIPALYQTEIDTNGIAQNNFKFTLRFKNTERLTDFFFPEYSLAENSLIEGVYRPEKNHIKISGYTDHLLLNRNDFYNLRFSSESNDSLASFHIENDEFLVRKKLKLQNINIRSVAIKNHINLTLDWLNEDSLKNYGSLAAFVDFSRQPELAHPLIDIEIEPTEIYIKDSLWNVHQCHITLDSSAILVHDFSLDRQDHLFFISGAVSEQAGDTLHLEFRNLNLASINMVTKTDRMVIDGKLNGKANLSGLYTNPLFNSDIMISNLLVNNEPLGDSWLISSWDTLINALHLHAFSNRGEMKTLDLEGDYFPSNKEIDFDLSLNKLRLNIFRPFLRKLASDLQGIATGNMSIEGSLQKPVANGSIKLQKTSFIIDYLQTKYNFSQEIFFEPTSIRFNDIRVFDTHGNTAILRGAINHDHFRDFNFDIRLEPEKFLLLATDEEDNNLFYGTAFGTGIVNISGPPKNLRLDVSAKTEENTKFYIPLNSEGELAEYDYVTFLNTGQSDSIQDEMPGYEVDLSGIEMNFDLEITPDVEVQLIFDSKIGDIIQATGEGNLNLQINTLGDFRMYGDYRIESGEYLFTLQNIINKKFSVRNGGTITWNGQPDDAFIDLQAIYSLRTSLGNLFNDGSYSQRIPVECQLNLSNKLLNPDIVFGIGLPTADEEARTLLQNSINTEDRLSKQFLSLLVINSFLPDPNLGPSSEQSISAGYTPVVGVTTSELLSNQLSHWLSQISNDFDIGFSYMPGDDITSNQVEVALSTQLLNDRVTINTNVDVGGQSTTVTESTNNTSNIVGDFTLDIKLNQSGKLRMKAFNRANNKTLYELAPYTQGIGLFYREEFNNFEELVQRYWSKLFTGKEKE